jgi:hypothetical protein
MRCASRAATGHSPTVRCAGRPWPRCGPERVGRCGTSGEGDEFLYWYVNFERNVRRTSLGFDIVDEKLDLIARPDGRIVWKDEAELEQAAVLGLVDADEVRATAERFSPTRPGRLAGRTSAPMRNGSYLSSHPGGTCSVDEPAPKADRHSVSSRAGAELRQEVVDVRLHRLLGEPQTVADLAVEQAIGHQRENLQLPSRQWLGNS